MIIFLIISFIFIILNILIIGFLFSKIVINIDSYNLFSNSVFEDINIDKMQISINLYFYKIVKILSIKFYRNYFKIGFIKFRYFEIKKYKNQIANKTLNLSKALFTKNRLTLNTLKPSIELFQMNLSLCSKNAAFTSILSSIISILTSTTLSKFVKKYNENDFFYKIIPVYFNVNGFKLEIKAKVKFNTFNILEFLIDYLFVKNNK